MGKKKNKLVTGEARGTAPRPPFQQKSNKIRLDQLLVDRGLTESKSKAQALIIAGKVYSDTKRLEKPGQQVKPEINIEIKGQDHPWVSRGGLKLEKALDHFDLDPSDRVAVDLGSSTGGFTDVLLTRGATKVYAVDVGTGQLHWKLRTDDRVVVMEKTNARYLTAEHIPDPVEIIVCDASFISLKTILPATMALAAPDCFLAVLIKPQFEAGPEEVGKGGIIRDPAVHERVCADIESWMAVQEGWTVTGITDSPIKGAEGNREFLIAARKN